MYTMEKGRDFEVDEPEKDENENDVTDYNKSSLKTIAVCIVWRAIPLKSIKEWIITITMNCGFTIFLDLKKKSESKEISKEIKNLPRINLCWRPLAWGNKNYLWMQQFVSNKYDKIQLHIGTLRNSSNYVLNWVKQRGNQILEVEGKLEKIRCALKILYEELDQKICGQNENTMATNKRKNESEIVKAKGEIEKLRRENEELKQQLQDTVDVSEMNDKISEIERNEGTIEELRERIKKLEGDLEKERKEKEAKAQQIEGLKKQLNQSKEFNDSLNLEVKARRLVFSDFTF